ncbi:MAG: BlaI/MecI/CopY family transcriptional regulator [Phycisphaerae bacterium]|nr:BlaI/MecI/CopY family transcriptional regulator [Phycisphaerae bacterium]
MEKIETEQKNDLELTDAQWAIIKVVWDNEPCAAGTVQENLESEKGWAYSTVKTTMDRMVKKGLLKITKIRNLQLFSSCISRDQACKGEFQRMLKRAFDGAMNPMLQFLIGNDHFSDNDLNELRKLVASKDKDGADANK